MTMNMNKGNNCAITFKDQEHEMFYMNCLSKCKRQDHKALVYCLGISRDTRQNIERIFDFDKGSVKTECLEEGWITSGSARSFLNRSSSVHAPSERHGSLSGTVYTWGVCGDRKCLIIG